jgi:hypothetical protein
MSHTRADLSDAVTTRVPSGLKLADLTPPSCLRGSVRGWPVRASHTRAILPEKEAVTTRVPSELKLADETARSCLRGSVNGCGSVRVPHPCGPVERSGDNAHAVGREPR